MPFGSVLAVVELSPWTETNTLRDRAASMRASTRGAVRIEVMRERAVLEHRPHLRRRHRARAALRLQHQRRDRRGVGRGSARSEEIGERVEVAGGVRREERRVAAVHRREVGLQADLLGIGDALIVAIPDDAHRSRRREVLRDVRLERAVGRHAVGTRGRIVAVGDGRAVREVLGRRARGAVGGGQHLVAQPRCRSRCRGRGRARDHHLHLRRCRGRERQRAGQLDRPVGREVVLADAAQVSAGVDPEEEQIEVGGDAQQTRWSQLTVSVNVPVSLLNPVTRTM